MNWKAGDRAIVLPGRKQGYPELDESNGSWKTCVLVRYVGKYTSAAFPRGNGTITFIVPDVWIVAGDDQQYAVSEPLLMPLDEDDDKSTWEDCAFKPKVLCDIM